jgi:hypothetical protein
MIWEESQEAWVEADLGREGEVEGGWVLQESSTAAVQWACLLARGGK